MLVAGQLLVLAHACSFNDPASVQHPSAMTVSSGMHCHQDMNDIHTDPGKGSISKVCQDHCAQPAQSSHTAAPEMPIYSLVALFHIPRQTVDGPKVRPAVFDRLTVLVGSSPPIRIQYQIFRI